MEVVAIEASIPNPSIFFPHSIPQIRYPLRISLQFCISLLEFPPIALFHTLFATFVAKDNEIHGVDDSLRVSRGFYEAGNNCGFGVFVNWGY
ncbi:unnamed protein product [Camellia sinensis]